jgi:hypothetical protein
MAKFASLGQTGMHLSQVRQSKSARLEPSFLGGVLAVAASVPRVGLERRRSWTMAVLRQRRLACTQRDVAPGVEGGAGRALRLERGGGPASRESPVEVERVERGPCFAERAEHEGLAVARPDGVHAREERLKHSVRRGCTRRS